MPSKTAALSPNEFGCKTTNYILHLKDLKIGGTQPTIGRHMSNRKIPFLDLNCKGTYWLKWLKCPEMAVTLACSHQAFDPHAEWYPAFSWVVALPSHCFPLHEQRDPHSSSHHIRILKDPYREFLPTGDSDVLWASFWLDQVGSWVYAWTNRFSQRDGIILIDLGNQSPFLDLRQESNYPTIGHYVMGAGGIEQMLGRKPKVSVSEGFKLYFFPHSLCNNLLESSWMQTLFAWAQKDRMMYRR